MPLRIAFDLDGVLADMESELVRQAEVLFGEAMTHRLQERAADPDQTTAVVVAEDAGDASTEVALDRQPGADATLDNTPPLLKLNMTARHNGKLGGAV